MTVELYIVDELIVSVPVNLEGCLCCEEKQARVHGVAEWIKYQYRATIIIHSAWYIIASQESKMNELKIERRIASIYNQ